MNKEQLKAVATLVWMMLSYVSAIVVAHGGHNFTNGMTEASVLDVVTGISAVASTVYGWWSNNNVTKPAQEAQAVKDKLAAGTPIAVTTPAVVSAPTAVATAGTADNTATTATVSGGTVAAQPGEIVATPEGK